MCQARNLLVPAFGLACLFTFTGVTIGASPLEQVRPFLARYCTECHGAEVQENSKRFDNLQDDLTNIETLQLWQGIVDQLNLGDMPPKDSLQPNDAEITKVIKLLTPRLQNAYAELKSTGAQTVARRLNLFELRNTVRDLL